MKKTSLIIFLLVITKVGNTQTNVFPSNGNVGIGTGAPNEKLDVRGNLYMNSGTNNNHIFWYGHHMTMGTKPGHYFHNIFSLKPGGASQGNLVSKFQMYTVSSDFQETLKVRVNTAGSSFFNGGNVGIGTSAPQEKLDVRGNLYINSGTNNNHIFWSGHHMTMGTKPGHYYHNIFSLKPGGASQGNLVSKFQMYTVSSNFQEALKVLVNTAGSSFFNGGNVGIGTTTPGHKLDVNGVIRAKEIKVETDWSDFVFEDDYNLKSLDEVEAYINKNKHLPDIPSESEVKEKGINLGEINAKLLQKIEELTLYVIEQNKKGKAMQKEINKLKKINAQFFLKLEKLK